MDRTAAEKYRPIFANQLDRLGDVARELKAAREAAGDSEGATLAEQLEAPSLGWKLWVPVSSSVRENLALTLDPNAVELERYPWPLNATDLILGRYSLDLPMYSKLEDAPTDHTVEVPQEEIDAAWDATHLLLSKFADSPREIGLLRTARSMLRDHRPGPAVVEDHPEGHTLLGMIAPRIGSIDAAVKVAARVLSRFTLEPKNRLRAGGHWEYSVLPEPRNAITGRPVQEISRDRRGVEVFLDTVRRLHRTDPHAEDPNGQPPYQLVRRAVGPWVPADESGSTSTIPSRITDQ